MSDEMSEADYQQMLKDRADIKAALNGPRGEEVRQLMKDCFEFPHPSGDLDS